MPTGTTSTTVTANWTVVKDANGFPTDVSGDDVTIYMNTSAAPFNGEAWSDIDLMAAIPAGATITDLSVSFAEQVTGSRQSPSVAVSPIIDLIDKAQYLAHTFILGYGEFGAGGVGNLPNDGSIHSIDYVNSVYGPVSGGGGVPDLDALAAALSNPATPVVFRVQAQQGSTGTGLTYFAPITLTFSWETSAPPPPVATSLTGIPPLRQYPRSDGLGMSSARRLYPPPPTVQTSNRRGSSAIL